MKNILILCTGNSCRSQMADGFLKNYLTTDQATIYSAGVETHGVNPRAIKVMCEVDIDISENTSNHIDEYQDVKFDYIITVCDHAKERCPVFPSRAKQLHYNFPDPAKAKGSEEEIMESFRKTQGLIQVYLKDFVGEYFEQSSEYIESQD